MDQPDDAVPLTLDDGVLTATLDAPSTRNALTPAIEAGLVEAIRIGNGADVRAVVLTGRGPAFCAGANMKELGGNDARDAATLRARAREIPEQVLLPLVRLEKPVVAALNGAAVGAGIGLALAGDYRICAQSASFRFAFMRLGLLPDLGIAWMLPRLVGHRTARDLLLRGRDVFADEALEIGLADEVVPDDELQEAAGALARELAAAPTMAWGATKQLLRKGADMSLERFLDDEVTIQTTLVRTDDHAEGVRAFSERRPPKFTGR